MNDELNYYKLEFKFNALSIKKLPQIAQPSKPSQYLSKNYEIYHYDNCLTKLANEFNLKLPNKDTYLKEVHNINPKCMIEWKKKYKKDDIFKKKCMKYTKMYLESFIKITDLDIKKLTKYLLDTQDKVYMLYYKGSFNLEFSNLDNYELEYVDKDKNRYKCYSKNKKLIKVLIKWNNCTGIAFPGFQISES